MPVIWIFITASRLPAQWLAGGSTMQSQAQAFEEGNPIDRTFFIVLILLSLAILLARSFKWGKFFSQNKFLMAFVVFSLLSVLWSDFPFVAFKRWYRDLGNYLVIMVVLSDPRPVEAVKTLLRRLCYLLIPLSIVLIKYFPLIGRQYSEWTGALMYTGVTTGKNMLGAIYLVGGLFFFWDTLTRWSARKEGRTKQILLVNLAFIYMTFWLLIPTDSATSRVCLVLGCLVIAVVRSGWGKAHPGSIRFLIPATFCLYLIFAFGFNINGDLASAVGRDPTLTDRTGIWKAVLAAHTNWLVGCGYASFWLGSRLQPIWQQFGHINESHNGYLEVYLDLGSIGVALLVGLLVAAYQNVCRSLKSLSDISSLNLALWTIVLFYNMTEAAFKFHLVWMLFLLTAIAVPGVDEAHASGLRVPEHAPVPARLRRTSRTNGRLEEMVGRPVRQAARSVLATSPGHATGLALLNGWSGGLTSLACVSVNRKKGS
ncbi:MAG TPA: O-antigen ligase family protein [Candidatus Limnocylindrales bacterium]|nr:O-antigen ligase family protein [Candidatus Limnocylindrales bacterium]